MIGATADVIAKAEDRDQFKQAMEKIGLEVCRGRTVHTLDEARQAVQEIGLPCVVRPSFTLGGSGSGIAYNREEFDQMVRCGLDSSPVHRGADRRVDPRLERVRDGGDARRRRQRRDHLLDRELRPDGRPHRRLDHRRPGPDAHRQGIPADARRLAGRDPRDRRRDGRLEHPVRHQSAGRADDRHRDEPARQPLERLGLEGHRLPDRQDRRQAGRRLPPARAAQRHHPRDDGLLRADDRLRRHQGAALRLREIPRGRSDADHADEERRRDDGHRPHVQGVVPEGAARSGGRQLRLRLRRQGPLGHAPSSPSRDEIRAKLATPNADRVWYIRYAFKPACRSRRSTS